MTNIKIKIANELRKQLDNHCSLSAIASWAHDLYFYNTELSEPMLDNLYKISLMEADPEFVISIRDLRALEDRWKKEGEFEELGLPIPEIKQTAEDIGKGWIYCPICHEAWENESTYGMVECPGCQNKLHNPKYKML